MAIDGLDGNSFVFFFKNDQTGLGNIKPPSSQPRDGRKDADSQSRVSLPNFFGNMTHRFLVIILIDKSIRLTCGRVENQRAVGAGRGSSEKQ